MTATDPDTPFDVDPERALATIDEHMGPLVVDLDETLLLCNSTAAFLASAQPSLLAYLLIKLLGVIKPWRWTGGVATRDAWLVRTILLFMPWSLAAWRRQAPALVQDHLNRSLADRLRNHRDPVLVATLGFTPIVRPLIDAAELGDRCQLLSMSPWTSEDRRRGKLELAQRLIGADQLAASLVITDSVDDLSLLSAGRVPLRVIWPESRPIELFRHTYVPGRYLSIVKRPGSRYILKKVLREDLALWVLGSVWLADQPLPHIAGLSLLAVSFWAVYEMGYIDNDRIADRYEPDPVLTDEYHRRPLSIPLWKPLLWAAVAGVAGLWVLRWPNSPVAIDYLRWAAVLVATYGVFTLYNRIDKQTRVLLFPLLQLLRVGAFLALVPTTAIADMALIVQVIMRWVNYFLYRTRDGRWPTEDLASIRLIVFGAASVLLSAQHDWADLVSPTTLSLLAWHLYLARHTLPRSLANAHRIDRPPPFGVS